MLIEIKSPVFKDHGIERPPITFKEGLNVILGEENGAMSIGKSSLLLAIDFAFGGNTYTKSDGVKKEGHHTIYFAFAFKDVKYYFARNTENPDTIIICDSNYGYADSTITKDEFVEWLKQQYNINYEGLLFRIVLSSFFRIYGKPNTNELNPLQGIQGQSKEKSINTITMLYNRYQEIENYRKDATDKEERLKTFKNAQKYNYIANLVGGKKQYEENLSRINLLELQLATLIDESERGPSEEDIEKNKKKAYLTSSKLNLETEIEAKK